jgi:hypothetical protein
VSDDVYSLDTSALVESWRRVYPPGAFPALWERLDEIYRRRRLFASEEVLRELEKKDDAVHTWASERPDMFLPMNDGVVAEAQAIMARYPTWAKNFGATSRNRADPFVVALAKVNGWVAVTYERPNAGSTARPKIPYVCRELGVECIAPVELITREGWVFS